MLYKLSNVSIFLSNYNLNMDLIKNIHISSIEEAESILKSEISVSSLFGELKHTPKLNSYSLTKQNVQTKINKIFRAANTNQLTIKLKADNTEDVSKAFKALFPKCKVTLRLIEDTDARNKQTTSYDIIVQKVGTFHISVKVERLVYETCRMTYDLLNGTSGMLIDNTDSTDLEITSKNNAVLFVNNLTYKPKKDLEVDKL